LLSFGVVKFLDRQIAPLLNCGVVEFWVVVLEPFGFRVVDFWGQFLPFLVIFGHFIHFGCF